MRRMLSLLLVIVFVLGLTACGKDDMPTEIPDEPYTPVEYQLYPTPEDAYVGDTMPFVTEDGKLELYYLYDTDHNGQGYHPVWRYTTDDFVGYQDDGLMLSFGTAGDADLAIGTGSVMQDRDGLYHLFYTGHNDSGNAGKGKECVMHATSTDRQSWEKHPEDTFYSADNYSKDDFRDPEVFWVEEEQCYWLLIAARENTRGGVVAKYTSTDLKHWELCDPLFAPMQQYMLECPSVLHLGDKYYLTYSWDCVTYYAVSDSLNGPYTAPRDNVLDGNGFIFYAAKTKLFKDKPYLCGWLGRAGTSGDSGKYAWAGTVLNHQLVQKPDGSLGVREPEQFHDYFTEDKEVKFAKKAGDVKVSKEGAVTVKAGEDGYALADMGTRPATMLLECDVTMSDDARIGFAFGGTEREPAYTGMCLNATADLIHYEGTELEDFDKYDPEAFTRYTFESGATHHVKLVCENEIVVIYVDDAKVLSNRVFRSINGAHIGLFAYEGEATFSNVTMKLPAGQ